MKPETRTLTVGALTRVEGEGAVTLDAVMEALKLLEQRKPERRRVILLIAEKRDRSSKLKFSGVLHEVQRDVAQFRFA